MISKTVFALALSAVFALSVIFAQHAIAEGSHLDITKAKVEIDEDQIEVELETDGTIPTDGSAGAFGYAVLTAGTENVLAITTHLCVSDSPVQGAAGDDCEATIGLLRLFGLEETEHNDATFHPHILDLQAAGRFCSAQGAPLEVNIGGTVATGNNVSPTNYELKISEDEVEVKAPIDADNVNPDGSEVAVVSFEIIPNYDADGLITNLCVTNISPAEELKAE